MTARYACVTTDNGEKAQEQRDMFSSQLEGGDSADSSELGNNYEA